MKQKLTAVALGHNGKKNIHTTELVQLSFI